MKHVAIVGSRSRTDAATIERLVATLAADTVVISGGADGPDTWAEHAAQRRGLATRIFLPDLKDARTQGQRTRRYHRRNQRIVDAADEIFALVSPLDAPRRTLHEQNRNDHPCLRCSRDEQSRLLANISDAAKAV